MSQLFASGGQSIEFQLQHLVSGRTDGEAETPILWPPDAKS